MSGFVYFIKCEQRVKIGYSADPSKRLVKINSDSPFPCELIGMVSDDDFSEIALHDRFHDFRVHSEWFNFTNTIKAFVRENSFLPELPSKGVRGSGRGPLLKYRQKKLLTMSDLASSFRVTKSTLSKWENGVRIPAERVQDIALITGIPPHELRPDIFPQPEQSA